MHTLRILLATAFLAFSPAVFAHGESPSFEKEVDGYLMDIGYSIASPDPGQAVRFDFDLFTGEIDDLQFVPFTDVTLDITKDGFPVMMKTLPNVPPNVPGLNFAFSQNGIYDLNVAYNLKDGKKVQSTFEFPVGIQTDESRAFAFENTAHYVLGTIVLLVGLVAFVMIVRDRMRR